MYELDFDTWKDRLEQCCNLLELNMVYYDYWFAGGNDSEIEGVYKRMRWWLKNQQHLRVI